MKKLFIINVLLSTVIAVVACSKEENTVQETPEVPVSQTGHVSISANIPEKGLTKVSLTQDPSDADGVVKLSWNDTDVITVKNADDESKSVVFDYVSGAGSASAVFSAADVSTLDGATSYNIYLTSGMPADYSNQDGSMGYSATLLGVNKYDGVTFSQTWAEAAANGSGSCVSSSVLRIRAKMPSAAIASAVRAVIIKSDKNLFAGKDSIRIECTPEIDDDIISVYATLPAGPVSEATATKLLFQFQKSADKNDRLTAYREVGTLSFNDGSVNSFKISCTNIDKYAGTSDNGSLSSPYLVGDRNQLQYMNTLMGASEKHFKLIDNIKISGLSWTPLNGEGTKVINLDGNNKRISNLNNSLFADLNGTVKDLTIYNAVVSSPETVGILANTCNTAASTVNGVTVTGDESPKVSSLTNTATSDRKYVGGLVGEVSTASSFDDCHVINTTISSPASQDYAYIGGGFGYVHNASLHIGVTNKCTVAATSVSSNYYRGGLIGYLDGGTVDNSIIGTNELRCSISGSGNYAGGLIGWMESGTLNNNTVYCDLSGRAGLGGFIGQMMNGSLSGNSAFGTVVGTNQNVGGLIGILESGTLSENNSSASVQFAAYYAGGLFGTMNGGTVTGCYANGTVTSTKDANYSHCGGLVGRINGGSLEKCYATGDVEGKGYNVGGLVGNFAGGSIEKCHSEGKVKSTHTTASRNNRVGGFIGAITAASLEVSDSYSTGTVTGNANCGGFIGYCDKNTTITNGYTTSSVDATDPGALIGNHAGGTISGSGFIAWWASGNMVGTGSAHSLTTSYLGTTGSIYSQAVTLGGWDFVNVWTTDATPTLR